MNGRSSKSICIAVNSGFSIRYLLQTDVLPRLLQQAARVTVVTQAREVTAVRANIPDGVTVLAAPDLPPRRRIDRYFIMLRSFLRARYVTTPHEMFRRALAEAVTSRARTTVRIIYGAAAILRHARLLRLAVPWLEARLSRNERYGDLVRSIDPDLLVLTSHGAMGVDREIGQAAQHAGISTTVVILSWDNVTSHCYPAFFADNVAAWTDIMKNEASTLLDYRPERIRVCGVAHFDVYSRPDATFDRVQVLQTLGLDPARRTIVLATKSPNSYPWNPDVARTLAEAMANGALADCQLVIRLHPIHFVRNQAGNQVYGAALASYQALAADHRHVVINAPGLAEGSAHFAMAQNEMAAVCHLLRAADVLVNLFSTMNIEGALLNKPLVNVCYNGTAPLYDVDMKPRFDIFSDVRESHNQRIVDSGGTAIAYTPAQLIDHVATYLADPDLDRTGREQICDQEGGPYRGHAGRVLGDYLLSTV